MAVIARGHHVAQPRQRVDGAGNKAHEAGVVDVVAVADDVLLHLGNHLVQRSALGGNALVRDSLELLGRGLDGDWPFGKMAVSREQLADKAHRRELDVGFLRGPLCVHGIFPSL